MTKSISTGFRAARRPVGSHRPYCLQLHLSGTMVGKGGVWIEKTWAVQRRTFVPVSITMEIREREVVRFLHILFCLVIMVSNQPNSYSATSYPSSILSHVERKFLMFLWNNVKCQLDATRSFYWCVLSSTCFGRIRPWPYVPETCRAKNTSIKWPCCIKLAFHIISWGRCTVKQPLMFLCLSYSPALFEVHNRIWNVWIR